MTTDPNIISAVIPCHNGGRGTLETASALLAAARPTGWDLEVIVVDDGSTDGSVQFLGERLPESASLLALDENMGRARALNAGAERASGALLLLLDGDCIPASPQFLARHLEVIQSGAQVSAGSILNPGDSFWGWYQNRAAQRRVGQFEAGVVYAMTSANTMIEKDWFRRVGGFDPAYRHYGFEDRDLFLRLHKSGARVAYAEDAPVEHRDTGIGLDTVCWKMRESGRHSARIFSRAHPDAYRAMGLAAIDAREHAWLRAVGFTISPLAYRSARIMDAVLKSSWMPRLFGASIVKIYSALAFVQGTCSSESISSSA